MTNPKKFDLLVFDWDGTLVDSAGHIAASIQAACADLDLPVPSIADARHVIGLGMHDALAYLVPQLEKGRYHELANRYRYHFLAGDEAVEIFPLVEEGIALLDEMGYTLAVATGKSRVGLDRALSRLAFGTRFTATRCGDEGFPKPHPDMLNHIMQVTDTSASRTLMIGDTSHDLQLAANAGAQALAVSYGAHGAASLEECQSLGCMDSFSEVLEWLEENG
ncbi:MAG: HAD-IA family hydrolase [Betaproteobacteria bacterium]|nr:MAG: HAD-IA family hydrolase [Betaproteobacteria bacterium]